MDGRRHNRRVDEIAFDSDGLVPCVMQDAGTGEVLTLAYMNAEALARTRETGQVHFWSRSRKELWRKGETSGNTMALRALRYDCDADALVALVDPAGPACHTGERTCFYRGDMEPTAGGGAARPGAHDRRAQGRRRPGVLLHGQAAGRSRLHRREGQRGGRRGHAGGQGGVGRAAWPRRPPTCCTT